jgi:hypothetical protein
VRLNITTKPASLRTRAYGSIYCHRGLHKAGHRRTGTFSWAGCWLAWQTTRGLEYYDKCAAAIQAPNVMTKVIRSCFYLVRRRMPVQGYPISKVSISGSRHNFVNILPSFAVSTSKHENLPAAKTAVLMFS